MLAEFTRKLSVSLYRGQIPKLVDLVGKLDKLARWTDFIGSHQFEAYFNSYWHL